jgi:hypothetical protein
MMVDGQPVRPATRSEELDARDRLGPRTRAALTAAAGEWSALNVWDELQRRGWRSRGPHDGEMAALIAAADRVRSTP